MPKPLVRDDEPDVPEQAPERQPLISPEMVQKGESFWSMLSRFGGWLARQRLPEGAKKGLKDEWHYIWTNEKRSQSQRAKKPDKFLARPFQSFGVKDDRKKRKGRL